MTSEFAVHTEDGELEIAKRPVTVTAKGGEKQYDGKPLTAADTGYDIGGEGLVEGHEADVALSRQPDRPGAARHGRVRGRSRTATPTWLTTTTPPPPTAASR